MLKNLKKTLNLLLSHRIAGNTPLTGLQNQVVIVTGASKGLGKAIAESLLKEGCKVALLSRNKDELNNSFTSNENVLLISTDITNPEQTSSAVNETIKKFGRVDVLINNAGVNIEKPLEESTSKEINDIIDTNVKGAINMSSSIIPHFKQNKNGTIINIGSKISHNTNVGPNKVLYATSKYAIEGFSFALNRELKPFNIRVACLMPGTINTFVSTKSGNYMSPYRVAEIVAMVIKFSDIDFESMVFKSKDQDL